MFNRVFGLCLFFDIVVIFKVKQIYRDIIEKVESLENIEKYTYHTKLPQIQKLSTLTVTSKK